MKRLPTFLIFLVLNLVFAELTNAQDSAKLPVIGVWQWDQQHIEANNTKDYEQLIDSVSTKSPYDMLVIFLRFPDYEVTSVNVIKKMKSLSAYAEKKGIGLVPDLDIRNARHAFIKKHPEALQEMLRMKEVQAGTHQVILEPILMRDHYSSGNILPYFSHQSILHRVITYTKDNDSIVPSSVRDITSECSIAKSSADTLAINIPNIATGTYAMVIGGFKHDYPDIFSPCLLSFQRSIMQSYKGFKIAGACKDEWGFPPYFPRYFRTGYIDYWYSESMASAYYKKYGRKLIADMFLMGTAQKGKTSERKKIINDYNDLIRQRNVEIETDFYNATKDYYGSNAFVATHSTWWPYPDKIEMRKNGLDWWEARRDIAQSDEVVPFAVRTSLAKKWGSKVWYNQYYKNDLHMQLWSSALAGGRIDYLDFTQLAGKKLIEAEKKIHLLNFATTAPLDCRVAVVFGYHTATNWASKGYDDTGMAVADALWSSGYAADLIPSYEIENGSLKITANGKVQYGKQLYDAVVYYHPDGEIPSVRNFFASASGTKIFTTEGELADNNMLIQHVLNYMHNHSMQTITPCSGILDNSWFGLRDFNHISVMPGLDGMSRMMDGGILKIAAVNDVSGDTIGNFTVDGKQVSVDAKGLVYVRFDSKGNLVSMAAGDMKNFKAGGLALTLPYRMNIALRKNTTGQWEGEIQTNSIPDELKAITNKWETVK